MFTGMYGSEKIKFLVSLTCFSRERFLFTSRLFLVVYTDIDLIKDVEVIFHFF